MDGQSIWMNGYPQLRRRVPIHRYDFYSERVVDITDTDETPFRDNQGPRLNILPPGHDEDKDEFYDDRSDIASSWDDEEYDEYEDEEMDEVDELLEHIQAWDEPMEDADHVEDVL